MAKRVFCESKRVDQTLMEHAQDWVLVAVLASKHHARMDGEKDLRELYFERKGGTDEG